MSAEAQCALPSEHTESLNRPVFISATAMLLALVLLAVSFPDGAAEQFAQLQAHILEKASWFYVTTVAVILVVTLYLGVSRIGEIKLGPDHAEPQFNSVSWFAMLFSAGMGIGLLFFGVSEPVMHYLNPPTGEPGTVEAAREALVLTFFHWGIHGWAIYALVALMLAFFAYRHNLPLTLRSALHPLIGDRIYGPIGHAVDTFAIVSTMFGVATSLGYGVLQVNAGLNHLFGVPVGPGMQVLLVVLISALAAISVATGLERGIRRLSEFNMLLAVGLLLLVLFLGPTSWLMEGFVHNIGNYLATLVDKTFNLYLYESNDWVGGWTMLYWGWWLSWAPFVGMFIARISRGRTIREFVFGVLLVPVGFTCFWMSVFGNSAIDLILNRDSVQLAEVVEQDVALAFFAFIEHFPFSGLLSAIAIVMIVVFFVTSADSGAMVVNMLASGGEDKTPLWQRVFWAGLIGVIASVLLYAGGLASLQTATIASALPFSVALLLCTYGLLRALRLDATKREALSQSATMASGSGQGRWDTRLRNAVRFSHEGQVEGFVDKVVAPAMRKVVWLLREEQIEARVARNPDKGSVWLEVLHGDEIDFYYEVRPRAHSQPDFAGEEESDEYYRAEVHLREGGQDYDIMGWTQEQVLNDVVEQYEKHLHFLHMVR
ncbi:BCCT family transporter [Ferrimonas marina]|uniref:Choline/glycine/proline betaine transport protein n=1 Tax=Ferrimonas marina TaxID=299255 RepID=A0A1M5NTQ9_9GAMM|nr:choline BCCT transporter BetT [Ferrimonas marina]SHG92890.1 choline/glycine/proline betaine transport protein [Ferrimonas marina]